MTDLRSKSPGTPRWSRLLFCVLMLWCSLCQAQSASVTYTYDDAGRLKSAVYDDGSGTAYTLDAAGNRTLVATTAATPPGIPGAPSFSSITSTTATATWAAATGAVTGYSYSTNGGTTWVPVGPVLTTSLTGLSSNTSYTVKIEATNTAGAGPASSGGFATLTAPPPPGTPGIPTFTNIAQTTATVSWTAATGTVVSYEYSLNGGTSWTNVGTALTANLAGLTAGTAYTVKVHAVNSGGAGTASSAGLTTLSTYQITNSTGAVISAATSLYAASQTCNPIYSGGPVLCVWTLKQSYGSSLAVATVTFVQYYATTACPTGTTGSLATGYTRPSSTSCEIDATSAVYGH